MNIINNINIKRRRLNNAIDSLIVGSSDSTSPSSATSSLLDFGFGFNNPKFSNVILHVKTFDGDDELSTDASTPSSPSRGKRKRREDTSKHVTLHINSLLLSAHSDFFKSLFSNEMMESRSLEVPVYVGEDEVELLVDIIRFIYIHQFQTPIEDMLSLLFVADKFLFTKVADDIIEHHKNALSLERCIEYLDLHGSFQAATFSKLLHHVKQFLVKEFHHFDEVWNTDKFKDLPARAVTALLESNSLVVQSENTVLCGLLAWVTHDPENRLREMHSFIKHLRFGHMDPSFLVDVVKKIDLITSNPDFECIYKKVQAYKSQKNQVVSSEYFMIPRIYTDKGSMKFTWHFRQISKLEEGHPMESDKFYWRGYYLYLTVQKIDNKVEIAVNVDHQLAGLGQILAGQVFNSELFQEQGLSLKHESSLDLLNCYTGQYDRIVRHFTSYYAPGPSPVVLWHMPWAQFISPQYPHVGHDDVLGVKLKVKLRSRGMCLLCGSLAYQLCGRCRGIYYCSKECQKQHWVEHKKDCRPAAEAFDLL